MKYFSFKLFCLLNLMFYVELHCLDKNNLNYSSKNKVYKIDIASADDLQNELMSQLQTQLDGKKEEKNVSSKDNKSSNADEELRKFLSGQNYDSQEVISEQLKVENNEEKKVEESKVISQSDVMMNDVEIEKQIDKEIENKTANTSENKTEKKDELKDSIESLKIPDISSIAENVKEIEKEENVIDRDNVNSNIISTPEIKIEESRKLEDDENDLVRLLNKKQDEALFPQVDQSEVKLKEVVNQADGNKSFSDKIKGLFGKSDDNKKKEEENKKPVVEAKKIQEKPLVNLVQQDNKSTIHISKPKKSKPIIKEFIDLEELEREKNQEEYDYKVYEYSKKKTNLDNYKIVTEVPEFLENAHNMIGNQHISRVYSRNDYINTLFKAINDQDIAAIDRIFKIFKTYDVKRADGETPLIYAVKNRKIRSIEYLLMRGVDKNEKNKLGEDAKKVAVQNGFSEILEILKQD